MAPAHRRRPIPPGHPRRRSLRRPLGAALALSLAAGPLLLSVQAWAGESAAPPPNPTTTARSGGATDQPPDRTDRPGPETPRLVRPLQRVPGLNIIDADASAASTPTFGEPSIAINPANPQQIAITRFGPKPGSRWDNAAQLLYSTNGGTSWTPESAIPVPPGVPGTSGGPCDQTIDYGRNGTLYGTFLNCNNGANVVVTGSTTDPTKASSWAWNNPTPTTTQLTTGTHPFNDQPWLITNPDTGTPTQDNVYVGYQDFNAPGTTASPHDRVNVARNHASPVDFPTANDVGVGSGALNDSINGGLRLAGDPRNGAVYALYQQGGSNMVSQPQPVTIRINRSTDGGRTWDLGNPRSPSTPPTTATDGVTVASVSSDQGGQGFKFGGVNALLGGIHHAAVDPTSGDVFVAYGVDVSGTNQIRLRRLTDNGANDLTIGSEVNVSTSTNAALPSVAVLSDGTVGVLYLTSDGNNTNGFPIFTAHLARSFDHGATFTDFSLRTYTTPMGTPGAPTERLFGDYEQLKAVGTTFYGAFVGNLNGTGQTTAQPTDTIFFSVPKTATSSTLTSSANPSVYGQPVTFTATVVPTPDGGTVTFKVDGTQLGSPVPVDTTTGKATSAAISSLTVGDHTVEATYSGDLDFQGNTAMSLTQTVNQASVTTTLASSDGGQAAFGQPVTFTDTVCPAPPSTDPALPPSGTVTFRDGSTVLGTGTLAPGGGAHCGQAQVTFGNLLPGSHTITAQYSGDGSFLAGGPETLTEVVTCANVITGDVHGGVDATAPSTCVIGATVHGSVRGAAGGALFIGDSTVFGGVHSENGTLFGMCGSSTTGTVEVGRASGFVLVGDPGDDGCTGNRVNGSVHLDDNHAGAELIANRIGGSVEVNGTTGTGPFPEDSRAEIEGNTIGGSLHCTGNNPPPTNGGNPNTVHGARTGQCANL
ncbi:Ig-like domain-containing protein [Kitasatospora sp. NPDC028055]|uniref:Ig-like domain-containing protein n=1 Tax=Kitasatospora sp. NPDC028055 TaxID=3155653 RepID=UPI0034013AA4